MVEVAEQEVEQDRVHADPPDERLGIVALDEEQLEGMEHHQNELDHLEASQVLLPPEVGLHLRAESGEQIVRVHDYVNEGVEQTEERAVATWKREKNVLLI